MRNWFDEEVCIAKASSSRLGLEPQACVIAFIIQEEAGHSHEETGEAELKVCY